MRGLMASSWARMGRRESSRALRTGASPRISFLWTRSTWIGRLLTICLRRMFSILFLLEVCFPEMEVWWLGVQVV